MSTAVAYIRVSTEEQSLGPDAQRAAILDWSARAGVHVARWEVDRGVSGAAPIERRPGLVAALASLNEDCDVLVAAKRCRLARDVVAAATIEGLASRAGAKVVTADGISSADTPEGALMRTLIDAFAAYERSLIAARTAAALEMKRRRGERVGQVPYGFRVAADGVALAPDAVEQAAITRIQELNEAGVSVAKIVYDLEATGAPARGSRWHATTVRRILARHAGTAVLAPS